ncbi:lisH domain-containing protein ARMC9-like isoform X3 [Lytechinus pictus]|uniref:lisH domain-containing protein ARMC9-like isoform X3 n=1 Tax=Lytechinus pictus TaxID=7653 RepID=UPI0030BA2AD9
MMGSKRNGSAMTVVAFEGELNGIVKEYLDFCGLEQSHKIFEAETKAKGRPIEQQLKKPWNRRKADLQSDLLALFKTGARYEFFAIWDDNIPEQVRSNDPVCKKLEFYLNIYFAIFPIKYQMMTGKKGRIKLDEAMEEFKKYLETGGASLSQTTEFLPFYALPFVPDPTKHPSYKELFQDSWVPDLQVRLEKFMAITLPAHPQPRLFELYQDMNSKNSEQLQKLQNAIVDAEKRNMTYVKRYNKIQADYHNLIGITAELVDSLESCIKGKTVTPEYVQMVCQRLFSNQLSESVDVTRPPTAASVLKVSMQPQHRDALPILPSLDYKVVRRDMVSADDRRKALLLQALRWRLTRSEPGEQRGEVISAYIKNDILGCAHQNSHREKVIDILTAASDEVVQQYMARLFNAFASLSVGRTYLGRYSEIVSTLQRALQSEDKDSITRENALGTLQKLSLKRHLQTSMIEGGIIKWLVKVLEDSDSLSDYTLEYSIALLMNLCLRTTGKRKCVEDKAQILNVISDLLGHEDNEIRPYVNGTLYSILSVPDIREEAKSMGMEEILKCFIKEDTPEMNRQIHFIIKQLNSDVIGDEVDSDDEDEEDEEDQDQDAMEADLDKAEVIKAQQGELVGEKLLMAFYMWDGRTASRSGSQLSQRPASKQSVAEPKHPAATNGQISRPQTSSGSRAGSAQAQRAASANGPQAAAAGEPSEENESEPAHPHPNKQVTPIKNRFTGKGEEYDSAFGSKPKIPRTPEPGKRPGSRGMTPPPPIKSSDSPPPSRPSTATNRQKKRSAHTLPPVENVELAERAVPTLSHPPSRADSRASPESSISIYISDHGTTPTGSNRSGSRLASVKSVRSVVSPGEFEGDLPVSTKDERLDQVSPVHVKPKSAASRRQGSAGSSGRNK